MVSLYAPIIFVGIQKASNLSRFFFLDLSERDLLYLQVKVRQWKEDRTR